MDRPKFKILRSPSLKRKQRVVPLAERVKLERVLGLTVTNNAALSVDRNSGIIAYPAGCVVVLYSPKKGRQTHIFNASKKTLTCLAFSGDGKHLVTGESGHQPAVRVWSLEDNSQVAELQGHKFGVSCVAFSPNLKYIVSIGTQHDMMVNVWNWKTNIKVASNKVASKVTDVAFSEDGSMFVTVGNRHVKFWYLDASKSKIKTETLPLQGRNGILGEHQNNFFCGVCCGKGQMANSVYAITESGLLCEFDQKRLLVKWVTLRTDRANAICLGEEHIFIGCASGVVRVFSAKALNYLTTLPRPHHLGIDVSHGLPQSNVTLPDNARFPDTIAVKYDDASSRLTCIYNDHSLYVWDVSDVLKVAKTRSFLFHSGAVWGADVYPEVGDTSSILPPGSFVTCSSDNTIRIWNCSPSTRTDTPYRRNIYCNELLKVLYVDPDLNNLLDIAYNPAGKTDKTDTTYQEKNGIRSVRFSPDGKHLATGDRAGNLRVHELLTMQQISLVEAHDSEVLCLEYTQPATGVNLLATASRDRLLHVFDVENAYRLVQTLDDHSSAITAIKFIQLDGQLLMLSCGADKSLLFRNAQMDPEFRFVLDRHLVSRTTLYDMAVDTTGKFVATACQDRNIRIYNTRNGKHKKSYSGSTGTEGTLLRVDLDPSGYYVATSCSDKNLCIYDFCAGECVASMFGHSEIAPGIKFLNNFKHVVSVSVDGCIFIWRLPSEFSECMMGRIGKHESTIGEMQNKSNVVRRETFVVPPTSGSSDFPDANRNFPSEPLLNNQSSPLSADSSGDHFYRFSVGQLPTWAKPRVQPGSYEKSSAAATTSSNTAVPKGKWARDTDTEPLVAKPLFGFLSEENRLFGLPASLTSRVSVIADDELNQDDEAEDEFSPEKSRQDFSGSPCIGPKILREISDNSSNSIEDEDEAETNEMLYYMPNSVLDTDPTATDSTFMVQENDLRNFKECLGVEGNEFVTAGEEEDVELMKSRPNTPTNSSKGSDVVSPSDPHEKPAVKENFESLYPCKETFEETLKKLEDEMTARFDNESHLHSSRHSISSLFFDKSQQTTIPSQQSRPATSQPSITQKENLVKCADEGKKNQSDTRDQRSKESGSGSTSGGSVGGGRRYGRSLGGGENKLTGVSSIQINVGEKNLRKWSTGGIMKESPPRKWKSMYDVSGGVGSVPRSTTTAPSSKPGRSKTPTLLLSSRIDQRSVSPPPSSSSHHELDLISIARQAIRSEMPKEAANRQLSDDLSNGSRIPMPRATKTETKLDTTVSFATLPKTRGKAGRLSADTALNSAGVLQKSAHAGWTQNLPSETDTGVTSSQQKRKPVNRVQSYRMQTESSLAKLSAAGNGDSLQSKVTTRRSGPPPPSSKYQSAPNLLDSEGGEENGQEGKQTDFNPADEIRSMKDRIMALTKTRQFSPVPENENEPRIRSAFAASSDVSPTNTSASDTMSTSLTCIDVNKNANQDPMPPPLTTDIPTSIHTQFMMKAAKYRRSAPSDISLSQAKNILMGKGLPPAEPSPVTSAAVKESFDASPLDLPVRDTDASGNRFDHKVSTSSAKSVSTIGRLSITSAQKLAASPETEGTQTAEHCESTSSPKIVKIGQCTSPIRPFSAGPTEDRVSGYGQRRILPAEPKLPNSATRDVTRDRSTSIGGSDVAQPSLMLHDEATRGLTTTCDALATATKTTSGSQLGSLSGAAHVKSGAAALGRSSPFKMLLTSSDADATSAWMKKAQSMQQQWEQRKKGTNSGGETTPEASATSTGIINEIERHCEELRLTEHEKKASRPTKLSSSSVEVLTTRPSAEDKEIAEKSDAETAREQWGLASQIKLQPRRSSAKDAGTLSPLLTRRSLSSHDAEPVAVTTKTIAKDTQSAASQKAEPVVISNTLDSKSQEISSGKLRCFGLPDVDPNHSYFPKEGEPDMVESFQRAISQAATISSHESRTLLASNQRLPLTDETEEKCAKVASELTDVVTKVTQVFTQLSNDSINNDASSGCTHALKLLRETISEAKDQLMRMLESSPSTKATSERSFEVDERVLEMLDSYSQQLYDLFKKKLENDQ